MSISLEVTATPLSQDLEFVSEQLAAFNDSDVGPSARQVVAVLVRDESGAVVAGIYGYTAWGWLYVQWLWVDEKLRGQQTAAKMLDAVEQEALARGCHGALIDTFSPKAERVYQRQGYRPFGVLPDFPIGRSRVFLQKQLRASG